MANDPKVYRARAERLHEEATRILGQARFDAEEKRKEARRFEDLAEKLETEGK